MCIQGLKLYTYFQSVVFQKIEGSKIIHTSVVGYLLVLRDPSLLFKNNFKGFLFIKIWYWICIKSEDCSMLEYFCHLRMYSLFWFWEHCLQEVHSIWYGVHVFLVYRPTLLRQKLHDADIFFSTAIMLRNGNWFFFFWKNFPCHYRKTEVLSKASNLYL